MKRLRSIMAYFATKYPHKKELSKARLTKLVYLADWFSAVLENKQMTDIEWVFNHYGPYVDDIVTLANIDDDFTIISEKTVFGGDKYVISFSGDLDEEALSDRDKSILDAIISKTEKMYFNEFINYVYSTYTVSSNEGYADLDLVCLAKKFNEERAQA